MPEPTIHTTDFGDPANGASITIVFSGLQAATQQQAISVAAWLRNIALEVEDASFRVRVDPTYTCRYCQPLNAE